MTPEISDFFQSLAEQRGSVLMERVSEFSRFSDDISAPDVGTIREKSLEELFADFYEARCGGETPDEDDSELLHEAGELLRNTPPDPAQRGAVDAQMTAALLNYLLGQEGRTV
jgi:hypothetical protein